MTITFDATSVTAGVYSTTLRFTSNDPDGSPLDAAAALTVTAPDIQVEPPSFNVTLAQGQTTTRTLTITNAGDSALSYSFNVTPTAAWLTAPAAGSIPAGGAPQNLTLTFDTTGLAPNTYLTTLEVHSNDPDSLGNPWSVPVHMYVTGVPDIALSADLLDFGDRFTGTTIAETLTVRNVGTDLLQWGWPSR